MYVYVIRNSATGKIYIGQHKGTNLKQYLQKKFYDAAKGRGGSSRLYASMRKHPREVWSIEPLFEGIATREELNRLETLLIALYDTRNSDLGYNICKGGEGYTGPFTAYMKEQWRKGNLAYWNEQTLVGQTFGRLHVQSECPERSKSGKKRWNCLCSCGETTTVLTDKLKSGDIKSCGCLFAESQKGRWTPMNLVGQVFGELTVKSVAEGRKGQRFWNCACSCGATIPVRTNTLHMGLSTSCRRCKQNKLLPSAIKLRQEGKKLQEIADSLGVCISTCSVWLRDAPLAA